MEEYSSEILYEYGKNMDYVAAKTAVLQRHKEIEEINKATQQTTETATQEQKIEATVDEIIAPVEIEDIETYQFEVKATKEQIKKIIDFMKELGVEYK